MVLGVPIAMGKGLKIARHHGCLPANGVCSLQDRYERSYGQFSTRLQFLALLKSVIKWVVSCPKKTLHSTINWIGYRCSCPSLLSCIFHKNWKNLEIYFQRSRNLSYVPPLDENKCYDKNWSWDSISLVLTKHSRKERCSTDSIFLMASYWQSWQTFLWTIHVYSGNIQMGISNKMGCRNLG